MPVVSAAQLRQQAADARRIAVELAQQAQAAAAAELEASRPREPVISDEDCPVVYFTRYQSGREYHYAAVGWRQGQHRRWAVTGAETRRFNWSGLLAFVGEANWPTLVQMTGGAHLLPAGAEPPVAERMGPFGRVLGTESVVEPLVRATVSGGYGDRFGYQAD